MEKSPIDAQTAEEIAEKIISNGEAVVRACLEHLSAHKSELNDKDDTIVIRLYRHLKEIDVQRQKDQESMAMRSIMISEDAAKASRRAAFWTMIAALASLASVLLSVASARHWFGL